VGDSKITKSEKEWRAELDPELYHIAREKGTESAFSGKYYKVNDNGMYVCAVCGNELFSSDAKFDSGSGWPSFDTPIAEGKIELTPDNSNGMERMEVLCGRCGSHLGHAFDDLPRSPRFVGEAGHREGKAGGPKYLPAGRQATGKRFCINSISLNLKKKDVDK